MKPEYLEAIINEISNTEALDAIVDACNSAPEDSLAELMLQIALIAMCVKRKSELKN